VAALVFTTVYTLYAVVIAFGTDLWMHYVPRPIAEATLVLGALLSVELLVLGLNASFLRDRLVPPERMRTAYVVLGTTAAAAFGLAFVGDMQLVIYLASLMLPGAAAYGILTLFSPAYEARQVEKARERERRRAAARAAKSGGARPPATPGGQRAQPGTKSRQRKGGRKRH
jgi:hypothetical protein